MKAALLIAASVLALGTGCADREQTASGIKSDTAPFNGTSKPYVAQGWKPGDKASWEAQLKTRTVNGQNDYVKTP